MSSIIVRACCFNSWYISACSLPKVTILFWYNLSGKSRQSSFLTLKEKDLKNAKLEELLNILEETEGKVIIWANWVHTLETVIKTLKNKFGEESTVANYGAISGKDREEAVELFQKNKNTRFFVSNPQTGGYGLTLTAASTVIYFSNNYDLEQRQQSEDRAHRIGQKNNVLYIDIIAKNTIDESVIRALNKKIKLSAETLGEDVLSFL